MKAREDQETLWPEAKTALGDIFKRLEGLKEMALESLLPSETLVVSIDMNQGFCKKGALYSPRIQAMIPETAAFLTHCSRRGYQVLPYTDCHTPQSLELTSYPIHCLQGTAEPELVEELSAFAEAAVQKNSTNGFLAKALDLTVLKQVVVTGCCTDICVYQYALTLKAYCNEKNLDCQVVVPMDLVETYDAPGHSADLLNAVFLDSMLANGVLVVKRLTY